MPSLEEIHAQIAELTRQAEEIKALQKSNIISEIREKIALYDLTARDLGFNISGEFTKGKRIAAETRGKAVPKYRDAYGNEWSGGRGRKPQWVQEIIKEGGDIEDYRIT